MKLNQDPPDDWKDCAFGVLNVSVNQRNAVCERFADLGLSPNAIADMTMFDLLFFQQRTCLMVKRAARPDGSYYISAVRFLVGKTA